MMYGRESMIRDLMKFVSWHNDLPLLSLQKLRISTNNF